MRRGEKLASSRVAAPSDYSRAVSTLAIVDTHQTEGTWQQIPNYEEFLFEQNVGFRKKRKDFQRLALAETVQGRFAELSGGPRHYYVSQLSQI